MFGKIKEILDLKEGIDSLSKELVEQKKLVVELSIQYKKEISVLAKKNKDQEEVFTSYHENLVKFKSDLLRELDEFRVINKGVQKIMLERFEKELTDEFLKYGKNLEVEKTHVINLKADIESVGKNLVQLNTHISRLVEVVGVIKKEDFELTQHHKMLLAEDKNKRELLAKIDTLERLMATMQRNRREEQRKAPYA
ncbi:MAG: hypothetical protein AABX52_01545 [Nanoarchaeota archaeon]|mgnify:CR=1 FL=1